MKCPVCKEEMVILELDSVEIDYCYSCSGIWLDEGELELLLEDSNKKEELLSSLLPVKLIREKSRRCPICNKKMEKVYLGNEKSILIDRCKKKHGLWFDKGELNDIIELASFDADNKVLNFLKSLFKYVSPV